MKYILFLLFILSAFVSAAQTDSMLAKALYYFELVKKLSASPEGKWWNLELEGPVLLVEPATRKVYANSPDKEGILVNNGPVYTGVLPTAVNMANTATTWAGVKWTMVLLPLPAAEQEAVKLLAHELFHRVQDQLGFAAESPVNDHLDTESGRLYLRLELEALKAALRQPVPKRRNHLRHALLFRKWRYQLFPGARNTEEALELNEGLAEFTGVYVSGLAKDTGYLPALADSMVDYFPTLVRSFAYITGPLYGTLLTQQQPGWQLTFTAAENLPDKLALAANIRLAPVLHKSMVSRIKGYNKPAIVEQERQREAQRQVKTAHYLAALVEGPLLQIPFGKKMSVSFNPGRLFPLGEYGTVYPSITVTDEWGRLVVTGDARMKDWSTLYITLPAGTVTTGKVIKTADWELTLADGWMVKPGERAGDSIVSRQ